jgi:hypothetical protein
VHLGASSAIGLKVKNARLNNLRTGNQCRC